MLRVIFSLLEIGGMAPLTVIKKWVVLYPSEIKMGMLFVIYIYIYIYIIIIHNREDIIENR